MNILTICKSLNIIADGFACFQKIVYVAGICRNPAFPEMPGVSSIAWAFPEMPRQLQKWYLIYYIQNLGNGKTQKTIP